MRRFAVLPIAAILAAASALAAGSALHVKVPMRDGVRLCTNVFVPSVTGRMPAILIRTPYGKGREIGSYKSLLDRGYTVVIQDVRGRYDSGGVFQPLSQEGPDGSDTLDWIARQEWSDGSVGMLGGSYLGILQWRLAILNNPHLKAISPVVSGCDDYRDRFYSRGGAFKLGHRLQWMAENLRDPNFPMPDFTKFIYHLPVRTADRAVTGLTIDMYQRAIDHPAHDRFWDSVSTLDQIRNVRIPVLSFGGWFDNYVDSDLEAFSLLRKQGPTNFTVIGPWPHNMSVPIKTVDLGPYTSAAVRRLQLDWFDYWLKTPAKERAKKLFPQAPLRIFVMGANVWREEQEWPLARAVATRFYLASNKGANSIYGDGTLSKKHARRESSDKFLYDPRKPVPTVGGAVCCNPKVFPWGPMNQASVEKRRDVLVYTTKPLKKDLEVTGPVKAVLNVSTSARDTDFTAKLVDVYPDGRAMGVCDGILRLRYRETPDRQALAEPGKVYEVTIYVGATSNVFKAGHSIRLEIASANFPRFDRNLNTGRNNEDETEIRTAIQTVYQGRKHPSYLVLPVVPSPSATPAVSRSLSAPRR